MTSDLMLYLLSMLPVIAWGLYTLFRQRLSFPRVVVVCEDYQLLLDRCLTELTTRFGLLNSHNWLGGTGKDPKDNSGINGMLFKAIYPMSYRARAAWLKVPRLLDNVYTMTSRMVGMSNIVIVNAAAPIWPLLRDGDVLYKARVDAVLYKESAYLLLMEYGKEFQVDAHRTPAGESFNQDEEVDVILDRGGKPRFVCRPPSVELQTAKIEEDICGEIKKLYVQTLMSMDAEATEKAILVLLGNGIFAVPAGICIRALRLALLELRETGFVFRALREIKIVDNNKDVCERMAASLKEFMCLHVETLG